MRALVVPVEAILLDAMFESELAELDDDEAAEMLEMSEQDEAGLDQLARVGFSTLGLRTYLTAGPKESRAWAILQGATAPGAAGVIHLTSRRVSLRPRSCPSRTSISTARWPMPAPPAACAWRARTTSWPMVTWLNLGSTCSRSLIDELPRTVITVS